MVKQFEQINIQIFPIIKESPTHRAEFIVHDFYVLPAGSISGQNPVITHIFTSDPAELVYGDSVYLFTGHDEASVSDDGFRMYNWHVFSSADMVNWKDHGPVLSLSDFSWAVANAWAGQCIERDGKFYWYVPMSHDGTKPGFAIGVAVADHPLGPYTDALGKALITNDMTTNVTIDWDDIDPTVFIDDDGQAYLFWGNTSCKYVRLKDNMIELDGEIQYISLPGFTEAPWVHKHNDLYYLSYAAGYPEFIDYAISDSITGPWVYQGGINQLIENSPTNHQSIIEFKNQWYYIYHKAALPTGGEFRRSVAIDYMFYNTDSTIMEIVQTSEGVAHADSTAICPPVPLMPSVKINDGSWSSNRVLSLRENDDVVLSPQADDSEGWVWEGPGELNDSIREITLSHLKYDESGVYMATFTNSCGTKSYTSFTLNILPGLPPDIVSGKIYVIRPMNSEMALAVLNASESDGPNVLMWTYLNGTNQKWMIIEQDLGIYKIIALHSGKCLNVEGTVTTESANVRQWTCNGGERQQFLLIDDVAESSVIAAPMNQQGLVRIYPNPAITTDIVIDLSRISKPLELTICDLNGKMIYRNGSLSSRILKPDLKLHPGVYLVHVKCDHTVHNIKFVRQ